MYLRVQLFHLDNITIRLVFFFIRGKEFFNLQEAAESGEKKIFNKQILDKNGTAASAALNGRKPVFHMASAADSCLPCCSKLSPRSVVYASKTNN